MENKLEIGKNYASILNDNRTIKAQRVGALVYAGGIQWIITHENRERVVDYQGTTDTLLEYINLINT